MKTATTIKEVRKTVKEWRRSGLTVGLVPTMGFLHKGHVSLIERSVAENDRTVVSIFVNPIQFGENEDLESYPRDLERDTNTCKGAGADMIFCPTVDVMFKESFLAYTDIDVLGDNLCGKGRPGHFKGVCTVVCKLFNIITPDRAYFGQKDAQQLAIVRRMTEDLNFDTEIISCPTVREKDGLAMSSRNIRLTQKERRAATVLYKSLSKGAQAIKGGERRSAEIQKTVMEALAQEPLISIEYVEAVDWNTLQHVELLKKPALIAAAVHLSDVRLIDNYLWE